MREDDLPCRSAALVCPGKWACHHSRVPPCEYLRVTAQSETNRASITELPEATRPAVSYDGIVTAIDADDPVRVRRPPAGTRMMTLLNDLNDTIIVDQFTATSASVRRSPGSAR